MKSSIRLAICGLTVLCLASVTLTSKAQEEAQLDSTIRRLAPDEIAKYRAILNEPLLDTKTTSNARVEQQIQIRQRAARALGDQNEELIILRHGVFMLPHSVTFKNDLAYKLIAVGQVQEARKLFEEVVTATTGGNKTFYKANLVEFLVSTSKIQENIDLAKKLIEEIKADGRSSIPQNSGERIALFRGIGKAYRTEANLHALAGHLDRAQQSIVQALENSLKALANYDGANEKYRHFGVNDVGINYKNKIAIERLANRIQNANETLRNSLLFAAKNQLELRPVADIYRTASLMQFDQRNFVQAQNFLDKEKSVLGAALYESPSYESRKLNWLRTSAVNLWGQKKYKEALHAFEEIDRIAKNDAVDPKMGVYRFERGLAYLTSGKYEQAAFQFDKLQNGSTDSYPISIPFYKSQAQGLLGVALWRTGTPENRVKALPILSQAVQDYISSTNADYLENIGIRKEIRELIFATYIEAAASQANKDMGLQAFAPADWVRTGVVQEALNDAAIRSAFNNPTQQDLVRKDQDAKTEIKGLRSFLSGDNGQSSRTNLPEIAAQMRARIDVLEKERAKLQAQIKAQFPDYDRLVRPAAVQVSDVQARLGTNEALISILPTDAGTFIWCFNKGQAQFQKSNLSADEVAAMVKRIRATLDVAGLASTPHFDAADAAQLYDELVRPFNALLSGKSHVVVAAGGALAQIPMGVLLTARDATAPNYWIAQTAITHVPSATAWLAVKRSGDAGQAKEAFFGVGDPVFRAQMLAQADTQQANTRAAFRNINLTRAVTTADLDKPQPSSAVTYSMLAALPETRDEIKAIAQVLQADVQKDTLFGVNANKSEVLKANTSGRLLTKRVLSFATHGLVTGDLPNLNQPALALSVPKDFNETNTAPENVAKPLLTLEDVLGLKLNADWVVLSACNTAAADGKGEEALSGLARGFFYAGARSVLATHWAVDSESAAALTTNTFAHYTQNPTAAKAESLRQAMLKVMNDKDNQHWAHPAFWAPFALVGDGGR